jgi:lysophospholipase L1-like esterase
LFANSQEQNTQALSVYTPVHISDFTTESVSDWYESKYTAGALSSSWSIAGNKLTRTATGVNPVSILAQPKTGTVQNGKIYTSFTKVDESIIAPMIIARYDDVAQNDFYFMWAFSNSSTGVNFVVRRCAWGNSLSACATYLHGADFSTGFPVGTKVGIELEVEDIAANITKLTAKIYKDDVEFRTLTTNDTGSTIPEGKWGLSSYGTVSFEEFELYDDSTPPATDLTITPNAENVKFGDSITYSVADDEDQTVTFTDNGAGGSFSPSNVATLDSSNSYQQVVTYTPAKVGDATLNATSSGLNTDYQSDIFVSPYSTRIGFIGDSITAGVANNGSGNIIAADTAVDVAMSDLGGGFVAFNKGVSGSTTGSWLGTIDAVAASLVGDGVDITSIMLGVNDASAGVETATYKSNLQTIIDSLKSAGLRQVILQDPIWRVDAGQRLLEYQTAIAELVAENGGYVLQGDTAAYDYFAANQSQLGDGVHPSEAGHLVLGGLWADAILDNLEYEINPDRTWASSVNEFTLGEDGTLTLSIDKYFGEFTGVVKVNNDVLTAGVDYTASEGSTVIELLNSYLNTLGAGTYTLNVEFVGGVWVESTFTILADGTITPTPANPNAPAVPGLTSPNTGANLGKFVSENRGAVLSALAVIIAGLGISIVLVGRKLTKEI